MKHLIIFLIFSLTSLTTFACKCIGTTFKEGYSNSDIIFIGKVLSIQDYKKNCQNNNCNDYKVEFEIDKALKGDCQNLIIHTYKDTGGCGYPFRPNEKYLVYANNSGGDSYRVGLCSRTSKLDSQLAQSDIEKIKRK